MASNLSGTFNPQNPLLSGVFGKMNRASDHLKEMDACFKAWIETHPWATAVEVNNKGIAKRLYFRITNPVPTFAMLVAGDAIHNLRSALDHLAAAESLKLGKTTKGVYFPIGDSADHFVSLAKEKLRKCSPAFRDFIADLKPYQSGNDCLYALHHLDIIDKHQILVPIGAGSSVTIDADTGLYGAIDFSSTREPVNIPIHGRKAFITDGDTILDYSSGAFWFPEKTEIRTNVTASIVFGEVPVVNGREIYQTILAMESEVRRIVQEAEVHFFR